MKKRVKKKTKRVKKAWASFRRISDRFHRVGMSVGKTQFKQLAKLTQQALNKVEREQGR